jgi:predicted CoA-binding protein
MGSGAGIFCSISLNTVLTEEQRARYQDSDLIRKLLGEAKTIAVYGLSSDRQRASYFVASYLKDEGYKIIPVNPKGGEILGEKVYPDLQSIQDKVDIVDVFRPSNEVPEIVDQAIAKGVSVIWTQLRIIDLVAAARAEKAGIRVIMDKCIKMEHGRYFGTLHWGGMNTEIISARKAKCGHGVA